MSAEPSWRLRAIAADDLDGVMQLQARCYDGDFLESAEVYQRRLAGDHHASMGAFCAHTQALQAYAVAYWSEPGQVTPFDGEFSAPKTPQPILYLHDVTVAPEWNGRGLARALLTELFHRARQRGVRQAALVSVQGSQPYWARHGFAAQAVAQDSQQRHLRSYGEDAVYMVAALHPPTPCA